ncbi:hypothetical protein V2G26_005255 [Clonostachys chloroleuca]
MKSKTSVSHPFGNPAPFAEPAWYNVLGRRTTMTVIASFEQWEETGEVPQEEIVRWARSGLAFQDMPEKYRPGIGLPAGIPEKEWDIFHFITLHSETARVGYVGCLAMRTLASRHLRKGDEVLSRCHGDMRWFRSGEF